LISSVRRARCVRSRPAHGRAAAPRSPPQSRATTAGIPSPLAACVGTIQWLCGTTRLTHRCQWLPAPLLLLLLLPRTVLTAVICCCQPPWLSCRFGHLHKPTAGIGKAFGDHLGHRSGHLATLMGFADLYSITCQQAVSQQSAHTRTCTHHRCEPCGVSCTISPCSGRCLTVP
jgi:hypothetical protein